MAKQNYNDPSVLTDPEYAMLLAALGLSDEQARLDRELYGQRNTRDEGRVLPEMQRRDSIEDQNLALGYEQGGMARSTVRQDAARNLDASQGYAMEGARLGFADRGVDLDRILAGSLADSDRQRALGYGRVKANQYADEQAARLEQERMARMDAMSNMIFNPPKPPTPSAPMRGAPTSVDRPRDPYKRRMGRAF